MTNVLRLLGVSTALALTVACATIDSTPDAPAVTESDRTTAARTHPQILAQFGGAVEGPLAAYVAAVGERTAVAAGVPNRCTFSVVNSDVPNAFAIPGCYIYVTRGLLAIMNSEDELASVLGHEVGHVVADHSARRQNTATLTSLGALLAGIATGSGDIAQMAGQAAQIYTLSYSREQEFESDDLGGRYLIANGYNAYAAADMLQALGTNDALNARISSRTGSATPTWARSHPLSADRVARATARASAAGALRDTPPERVAPYFAAIRGMIWGDDPEQGFVNGRTFAHPIMRIAFDAPEGFTLTNTPAAVQIGGQNGRAIFSGGALQGTLEAYATNVLRQTIGQARSEVGRASNSSTNGLETVTIPARVQNQQGQILDLQVVAYRVGDRAYHFVTLAPSGGGAVFAQMLGSMRQLTTQQASALRARQIEIVDVRSGDTPARLSQRMAFTDYQLDRFLALNGLEQGATLRAGQQVKIITYVR